MPVRTLKHGSFFDPRFAAPNCLLPGTVPWLLANYRDVICPAWLLRGWRGSGVKGRCAWPAQILMGLLVLRWVEEGTSRLAAMRRAESDIVWRAALGLEIGGPTPSERTMRDFESYLRGRDPESDLPRYLMLHEHFVALARWSGCAADGPKWAMDSTPQHCYGAVVDTVRLLGDGVRQIGRRWARERGIPVPQLAKEWKLPLLVAKSTKGHLAIDWRDRDARSRVVTELAEAAVRVVDVVRAGLDAIDDGPRKRALISRCDAVLRVIEQDLELGPEGRLVIAHRVAANRVISITDPEARHGRKSKSQTFNGFKVNVLGDLTSGLITAVSVTAGNGHDAPPGHELIARAVRMRVEMKRVLADTAYGGAADRHHLAETYGITLIAPPPPIAASEHGTSRRDFDIDFAAMKATCPNGITTSTSERVEGAQPHIRFRWPLEACSTCPLRESCVRKSNKKVQGPGTAPQPHRPGRPRKAGRVLDLHPHEQELRAAREAWEDPDIRREYRERTQCERLISQVIRHGGRRARAWGQAAANLQAHAIVMRCNLELLARNLARQLEVLNSQHAA